MPNKVMIINSAEPQVTEFYIHIENILKRLGYPFQSFEYKDVQEVGPGNFDGVIISGSPKGNDIAGHHLPWFRWIKKYEKPILGICAGHHITGVLYGSELLRSVEPESGDNNVEIIKEDPIFTDMPKSFIVKQMHNDSITLPDGFYLLGSSKTCKVQMIRHKNKPLYTCQFHPEYYNHKIFENFINLIL